MMSFFPELFVARGEPEVWRMIVEKDSYEADSALQVVKGTIKECCA